MYAFRDGRMMEAMTFHQKLVKMCEMRGWKQANLARAVKSVSRNTVSRWWNGEGKPFDDEALKLARVLGVTLEYLADDAIEGPPPSAESLRDEHLVLETFHSLGIQAREAVRRLHGSEDAVIAVFRDLKITPEEAIRRLKGPGGVGVATPASVPPPIVPAPGHGAGDVGRKRPKAGGSS